MLSTSICKSPQTGISPDVLQQKIVQQTVVHVYDTQKKRRKEKKNGSQS